MPRDYIPTAASNRGGLHRRYSVEHADGSPTDPRATYFVLRLDRYCDDHDHLHACREAARAYGLQRPGNRIGEELIALIDELDRQEANEDVTPQPRKPPIPRSATTCKRCGGSGRVSHVYGGEDVECPDCLGAGYYSVG